MTDFTKRTVLEAQAHEMLDTYRDNDWSPEKAVLAMVFKAVYASSMPVDRLNKLADVLACYRSDMQPILTKAVRDKVLRGRTIRGVRHYEINFAD